MHLECDNSRFSRKLPHRYGYSLQFQMSSRECWAVLSIRVPYLLYLHKPIELSHLALAFNGPKTSPRVTAKPANTRHTLSPLPQGSGSH